MPSARPAHIVSAMRTAWSLNCLSSLPPRIQALHDLGGHPQQATRPAASNASEIATNHKAEKS
jgi:hypothetical protein